jgi:hypothetical protein
MNSAVGVRGRQPPGPRSVARHVGCSTSVPSLR